MGLEHFLLSLAACELLLRGNIRLHLDPQEYLILTLGHHLFPHLSPISYLTITSPGHTGAGQVGSQKEESSPCTFKITWNQEHHLHAQHPACLFVTGRESISSAFMQNERIIMNTNLN